MKKEKKEEKFDYQFISCPVCYGRGLQKLGLACSNCGGLGLGVFHQGKFFYWGNSLSKSIIELNYFRKKLYFILNFTALAIASVGFISLVLWLWQFGGKVIDTNVFYNLGTTRHSLGLDLGSFWWSKHYLLFLFWLSLLAAMFIFYRISQEESAKEKVLKYKYDKDESAVSPDDWQGLKKDKRANKIDVSRSFKSSAVSIVEDAFLFADKLEHSQLKPIHIFSRALKNEEVVAVFSRLNVDLQSLIEKLKRQLGQIKPDKNKTELTNEVKEILVEAYLSAYKLEQKKVSPINLLLPIISKDETLSEILYDLGVDYDKLNNTILWFAISQKLFENYQTYKKTARFKPASSMDKAYTAVATPVLNNFGHDLTLAAKWGRLDYCVAREEEIASIFDSIESGRTGVILVGETGVGKRTIINGVAQLMVQENVPEVLKDKRLIELDVSRLVSGAGPAQAQERMLVIADEVARAGNIILFINNIENIVGITAGEEESLDLSEVLANALDRNQLFVLAVATRENYIKYIEGRALGTALARVDVEEPAGNQAIIIIESKIGYFEGKYKVNFTYDAIEEVVNLSSRYMHDSYLPDKAVNILESVAVKISRTRKNNKVITKEDIAQAVSEKTGIPMTKVSEEEGQELLNLEKKIHQYMINQEEAVSVVASSLRRARAQLTTGKRPIANFLFLGPTGVGKTELAKTVARIYFGNEDCMVRLDMSEYQNQDSLKKMIGDNTGTKGYLTEAVRRSPFSLLLLDEFEKAHPDILNLFLQVMDDGRLTDGSGKTIDFTSCILIATSNAGAFYIQKQIKEGTEVEKIKEALINEHLNKVMRPELINRFDGIIVFKPLSQENVVDITKIMLGGTAKMLEKKGISLRLTEGGVEKLAREGFDPKFGARPLRRLLQDKVDNVVANKLLSKELARRDVVIINNQGEIEVEKAKKL